MASSSTISSRCELACYSLVIAVAAIYCTVQGHRISKEFDTGGRFARKLPGLWKGWLLQRSVDLSDIQWRSFRSSLPLLLLLAAVTSLSSAAVSRYSPSLRRSHCILLGALYVGYCHGSGTLMLLLLITFNYVLCTAVAGRKYGPGLVWTFNCMVLMAVKTWGEVTWRGISPRLSWLDGLSGPLRWDVVFNLTVLRCISFGCDYCWALDASGAGHAISHKGATGGSAGTRDRLAMELKLRTQRPLPLSAYCWSNYLAYLMYPPLYFSGPILSFNAFASQLTSPFSLRTKGVVLYALRWACCVLLLELITHVFYFAAMSRFREVLRQRRALEWGPAQACLTTFWVLLFMWLKFVVMWRFARLWALLDGIATVDNIGRCVCNNYDLQGFWQNWHCSFNQWLVRYAYIPLGGYTWRLANMWPIFTFVALWHDLQPRLLGWAWLTCGAFAPELAVKWAVQQPFSAPLRRHVMYRHLCACTAALNMCALIAANMVGFVVGLDGMKDFVVQVCRAPSFLLILFAIFFSAAHLMFQIRAREAAQGVKTLAFDLLAR